MTETSHSINGVNLDVLDETIGAMRKDPDLGKSRFHARNKWIDATQNCTHIEEFYTGGQECVHRQAFELHADEPTMLAGGDEAPNPVEHLLHALAACVTTSIVAHAAAQAIHIDELESEVEGDIDLRGFLGLAADVPKGYSGIRIRLRVKTDAENLERLKRLAEFSPVYNTITEGARVELSVAPK